MAETAGCLSFINWRYLETIKSLNLHWIHSELYPLTDLTSAEKTTKSVQPSPLSATEQSNINFPGQTWVKIFQSATLSPMNTTEEFKAVTFKRNRLTFDQNCSHTDADARTVTVTLWLHGVAKSKTSYSTRVM